MVGRGRASTSLPACAWPQRRDAARFQPQEGRRDPAERWGFPARTASGQPAWVRIPRGIVLPWLLDGQLWQLKLRTNREQPKYLAISGGHPCLFGADTLVPGEPAILAEGEFDAMLLWQEAGDLVGVATLGSCNRGFSARALRYLLGCPRLLVAYDVDAEGDKGPERLGQLSPRMQRVRPPVGKDVTAFWQAGGRVRIGCASSWRGTVADSSDDWSQSPRPRLSRVP